MAHLVALHRLSNLHRVRASLMFSAISGSIWSGSWFQRAVLLLGGTRGAGGLYGKFGCTIIAFSSELLMVFSVQACLQHGPVYYHHSASLTYLL